MNLIIVALIIMISLLLIYIVFMHIQIKNISSQLDIRLNKDTHQPINVSLISRVLNNLVININKSLKAEENFRLKALAEEKEFRGLITNISHDLRTPLTAIKGYQQLMTKGELDKVQRERLEVARKHSDELGNLIEHFFEYSYFSSVEPEINIERINVTNLLTECLVASITSFEEKGISIVFQETPPIFIESDKELLIRIIQNLIRNCIQHSYGDVVVKLIKEDKVKMIFENPIKEGNRIDVNRLFDRFYTGDKARSSSTGLGLSIVKILTEKLGGEAKATVNGNNLRIAIFFNNTLFK